MPRLSKRGARQYLLAVDPEYLRKACSKCGFVKPLSAFYENLRNRDGFSYWCKECTSRSTTAYKVANPDKQAEYLRTWLERNAERRRLLADRVPPEKRCSVCESIQPRGLFYRRSDSQDGLSSECRACHGRRERARYRGAHRDQYLATHRAYYHAHRSEAHSRYLATRAEILARMKADRAANSIKVFRSRGILLPEGWSFTEALAAQSGCCKICEYPIRMDFRQKFSAVNRRPVPDHHHGTGRYRALLCDPCNHLLGWLEPLHDLGIRLPALLAYHDYLESFAPD